MHLTISSALLCRLPYLYSSSPVLYLNTTPQRFCVSFWPQLFRVHYIFTIASSIVKSGRTDLVPMASWVCSSFAWRFANNFHKIWNANISFRADIAKFSKYIIGVGWGYVIINHSCDVIMSTMTSQTISVAIVCSTVYSGADQRKHQSSASLAFVWGIHWWPVLIKELRSCKS